MKKTKSKQQGFKPSWDDSYYVRCYQLAKTGMTNGEIARVLKVRRETFKNWVLTMPALAKALKEARGGVNKGTETFTSYVYNSLSPKNKELWDTLEKAGDASNPQAFIESTLSGKGKRTRQMMWVHALLNSNFNGSEACRKVGVPKSMLDIWVRHDEGFVKLLQEIEWHKKNFFEGQFIAGVAAGEAALVLHAAKTQLADRGYGSNKTVTVNVNGQVNHDHKVSVGEFLESIPVEDRAKMLSHMRALREAKSQVQDAEIVPKEDE